MRVAAIAASIMLLLAPSAAFADDDSELSVVNDPALRDELLVRVETDQEARWAAIAWTQEHTVDGFVDEDLLTEAERVAHDELWARVAEIDANNTGWLKGIVNERGWPIYSDVGIDGGDAAWLLVQHADADPLFQRQCLDLMTELHGDEMSQPNLAYLTDRVLLAEGKNQIYGTQFVVREGKWVPLRLEDEENVDARRATAGLPSMAEYTALLEETMRGEKNE